MINRQKLIDKLKHWHLTNTEHGVTWLPEHFVAEAIEALSQPPADQWIPCEYPQHPCDRCNTGWGRILSTGEVIQCSDTCQKLKEYESLPEPYKGGGVGG